MEENSREKKQSNIRHGVILHPVFSISILLLYSLITNQNQDEQTQFKNYMQRIRLEPDVRALAPAEKG